MYIYIYMIMYNIYRGMNRPFELLLKKSLTKINFILNRITQPNFYKYVYSSMFKE